MAFLPAMRKCSLGLPVCFLLSLNSSTCRLVKHYWFYLINSKRRMVYSSFVSQFSSTITTFIFLIGKIRIFHKNLRSLSNEIGSAIRQHHLLFFLLAILADFAVVLNRYLINILNIWQTNRRMFFKQNKTYVTPMLNCSHVIWNDSIRKHVSLMRKCQVLSNQRRFSQKKETSQLCSSA